MATRAVRWLTTIVLAALVGLSAAAAAAAGPAADHPKRGVASARYLSLAPAVLSRAHAGWAYDWSATPPPRSSRLEWVPMVWGAGSVTQRTIATLIAARRDGRASDLLGFNEPDSGGQSNLTPRQAASLWPNLERTGLRLGSPAPAVPSDGWLARFMALARARRLRVDFIALHYYQDFTNPDAVGQLRRQLVAIHAKVRRPVWITEIGTLDLRRWHEPMTAAPTPARAAAYMRRLFAMLDGLGFVERYAWFTDSCWSDPGCRSSSLFTSSGHLTAAGKAFATAP